MVESIEPHGKRLKLPSTSMDEPCMDVKVGVITHEKKYTWIQSYFEDTWMSHGRGP